VEQVQFYEAILDNIPDGIYVLDNGGNYIFVNSAYVKLLHMTKNELLHYNVHDFYSTGQIDVCISDIVYREKHRVVMFQDVFDALHIGRSRIRQLGTSIPIFDEKGNVQNIVAIVKSLDSVNQAYYEASISSTVSSLSVVPDNYKSDGNAIIAEDPAMRRVLEQAKVVSGTESTVLITGESGAGKDLVARYIHDCSGRNAGPFVIINCASLPENLLEAELFGYERGAFTGAAAGGKKGLFEAAEGGTLFLDEINSLPLSLQGKLLRAIEDKPIQHIGSTQSRTGNFRLLVASNEIWSTCAGSRNSVRSVLRPASFHQRSRRAVESSGYRPLAEYFIKYTAQNITRSRSSRPRPLKTYAITTGPGMCGNSRISSSAPLS
jgi:PAS domain S-box-containing protein